MIQNQYFSCKEIATKDISTSHELNEPGYRSIHSETMSLLHTAKQVNVKVELSLLIPELE